MGNLTVSYLDGDRFTIEVRDHIIPVDQPVADGGEDTAPTPTELLVASLASCVAHYARRYLSRHKLPTAGLQVTSAYKLAAGPARITDIRVDIHLPDGAPGECLPALLAVTRHCTVHNTLQASPTIAVSVAAPVPV